MKCSKESQCCGTFECELCGLTAPYSYYGQKPPNAACVTLLEECYVMKDPFTSDKDKFLILGSQCSLCCKHVCVGTPQCYTLCHDRQPLLEVVVDIRNHYEALQEKRIFPSCAT
ncbi:cysteine-rich DPF motif domain-containing protein 1 isoform X2 [Podarcis muralis]